MPVICRTCGKPCEDAFWAYCTNCDPESKESLPVKYYQPEGKGPIYAVYGSSSIDFVEKLLKEREKFMELLDEDEDENNEDIIIHLQTKLERVTKVAAQQSLDHAFAMSALRTENDELKSVAKSGDSKLIADLSIELGKTQAECNALKERLKRSTIMGVEAEDMEIIKKLVRKYVALEKHDG